jgi:hypothetical protein
LAEVDEAFVCLEGDFVVSVDASVVVNPAVGTFDHPAPWLDDEAAGGFLPADHVDGDTGLGCSGGDGLAGIALVTHRWLMVGAICGR